VCRDHGRNRIDIVAVEHCADKGPCSRALGWISSRHAARVHQGRRSLLTHRVFAVYPSSAPVRHAISNHTRRPHASQRPREALRTCSWPYVQAPVLIPCQMLFSDVQRVPHTSLRHSHRGGGARQPLAALYPCSGGMASATRHVVRPVLVADGTVTGRVAAACRPGTHGQFPALRYPACSASSRLWNATRFLGTPCCNPGTLAHGRLCFACYR